MLPYEGVVSALVLDDAGKSLIFDLLLGDLLLNVNFRFAKRAGVFRAAFVYHKLARAGRAVNLHGVFHAFRGVDRLLADGADRLFALRLVIDDGIMAVRTLLRRQPVVFVRDLIAAGAFYVAVEHMGSHGVVMTLGTFDYKF